MIFDLYLEWNEIISLQNQNILVDFHIQEGGGILSLSKWCVNFWARAVPMDGFCLKKGTQKQHWPQYLSVSEPEQNKAEQ